MPGSICGVTVVGVVPLLVPAGVALPLLAAPPVVVAGPLFSSFSFWFLLFFFLEPLLSVGVFFVSPAFAGSLVRAPSVWLGWPFPALFFPLLPLNSFSLHFSKKKKKKTMTRKLFFEQDATLIPICMALFLIALSE